VKKILIGLLLFSFLVEGALLGLWWFKADRLQNAVASLANVREKKEDDLHIHYDALTKKGFPFAFEFVLENPRLTWKDAENPAAKPSEIFIDGVLTLKMPLLKKDQVSFKVDGKTHFSGSPNNSKDQQENLWAMSGDLEGTAQFSRPLGIDENITTFSVEDLKNYIIENLTEFSLQSKELHFTEIGKVTESKIFSLEKGSLLLNRTKNDTGLFDFTFNTDLQGLEFVNRAQFDRLRDVFPKSFKEGKFDFLTTPSKVDVILETHGTLPQIHSRNEISFIKSPPFFYTIDRLEISEKKPNFTNLLKGKLRIEKTPDEWIKGELFFNGTNQGREKNNENILALVNSLAEELLTKDSPDLVKIGKFLTTHQAELNTLLPHGSALKVHSQLEMSFQGKPDERGDKIEKIYINLKNAGVGTDLYGIHMSGDLKEKEGQLFDGNLTIQLDNYKELLRDFANYYNHWQNLLSSFDIYKLKLPSLSPQKVERTIHFLESLSSPPKKQQEGFNQLAVSITVRDSNQAKVKVGPLPLNVFLLKLMQLNQEVLDSHE
jgi:hypothetical protein